MWKKIISICVVMTFFLSAVALNAELLTVQAGEKENNDGNDRGWYWKPSYVDYSPSGMPDFYQKQDDWKTILPGPDGELDSTPSGDDVVSSDGLRIAPGSNCKLESQVLDDDVAEFEFCGPAAVANCFWWFDSKYEYEPGSPGDGHDTFPLVEDYGTGDDHSSANVPLLIEKLARKMKTCQEGITFIDDMQEGIDSWLDETGLSYMFEENTYYAPPFEFIEDEIKRSQDVILLLGLYDLETGDKLVDQQQTTFSLNTEIPPQPEIIWQMFFPTVDVLDAVNVTLSGTIPTTITAWIYDANWNLLGSSSMPVPSTPNPTWFQFHFNPSIPLVPGGFYFISLSSFDPSWNWYYWPGDPDKYDGPGTSSIGGSADFAFKTEYYDRYCVRKAGHFVTCAGVNSEELKIALSDPARDIANSSEGDHNDAQHVSHDIYSVSTVDIPCPCQFKWWIPDFPSGHDYAIVEQAVVICPLPSVEVEKKVWDEPKKKWVEEINAAVGEEVTFEIWVHNNGGYDLNNIVVTDTLPECLEYVQGSSEPSEPSAQGDKLTWSFQGPIKYCHAITIRFKAKVVSLGENINSVTVNAETEEGAVSDTDTATVNGIPPGAASVEVDKKVSDKNGDWAEEITAGVNTIVRFKISVHNNGDINLNKVTITDTLPECLEYGGNATPNEPLINENQLVWVFNQVLRPCETVTVEFDAHVLEEGDNINIVEVNAESEYGDCSDDDTATVIAINDTSPPTIEIVKPEKALYLFNNKILPFFTTFIIGPIDIEVSAIDAESGVNHVEFKLDAFTVENDSSAPYTWEWDTFSLFKHTFKAIAFDNAGNSAYDEIVVWKFL